MHPDTPAYVCYTSGSTGEPKGVVVAHRAIHRLVDSPSWMQVRDDDVFLQMTRVGFDVSTFEIWMPLVHGCRLALAPPGHADLAEIVQTLRAEGVTVLWLTTGLFHKMVTHHLPGLAGIRHLLAGGDVLSPAHVERVLDAHPHLVFTNGYGPTENTTFSTCWTTHTASAAERVPIGVPIDGTTVAILDDALRPVPAGETGELWVGGPASPPVTSTSRRPRPSGSSPTSTRSGRAAACTGPATWSAGSAAHWTSSVGADRQVKIRGYRVELSTVEMELLRQPGVEQAVALTRTDGAGDTRLLAYVAVGSRAAEASTAFGASLRERLSATVPAHLVPWAIIVLRGHPVERQRKGGPFRGARGQDPAQRLATTTRRRRTPSSDAWPPSGATRWPSSRSASTTTSSSWAAIRCWPPSSSPRCSRSSTSTCRPGRCTCGRPSRTLPKSCVSKAVPGPADAVQEAAR